MRAGEMSAGSCWKGTCWTLLEGRAPGYRYLVVWGSGRECRVFGRSYTPAPGPL
jgi:hypothetical protein